MNTNNKIKTSSSTHTAGNKTSTNEPLTGHVQKTHSVVSMIAIWGGAALFFASLGAGLYQFNKLSDDIVQLNEKFEKVSELAGIQGERGSKGEKGDQGLTGPKGDAAPPSSIVTSTKPLTFVQECEALAMKGRPKNTIINIDRTGFGGRVGLEHVDAEVIHGRFTFPNGDSLVTQLFSCGRSKDQGFPLFNLGRQFN